MRLPLTKKNKKVQPNGYGLVEVLVTTAIIGIILPVLHQISMIPAVTQAKQMNFQQAELSSTLYAQSSKKQGSPIAEVPEGCVLDTTNEALKTYIITCIHGNIERVQGKAAVNFVIADDTVVCEEDNNNGHGNDCDGVDDGNPGNSKEEKECDWFDEQKGKC